MSTIKYLVMHWDLSSLLYFLLELLKYNIYLSVVWCIISFTEFRNTACYNLYKFNLYKVLNYFMLCDEHSMVSHSDTSSLGMYILLSKYFIQSLKWFPQLTSCLNLKHFQVTDGNPIRCSLVTSTRLQCKASEEETMVEERDPTKDRSRVIPLETSLKYMKSEGINMYCVLCLHPSILWFMPVSSVHILEKLKKRGRYGYIICKRKKKMNKEDFNVPATCCCYFATLKVAK